MEDKEKEMSSKLQNLRAGLSRKRKGVSIKTNNLPNKKAKPDETMTRESEMRNFYVRRIADFDFIIDQLETGCRKCKVSPLKITNTDPSYTPCPNRLRIVCKNCQTQNSLIIHSREVEERLVLNCLHTGIGHSYLEALLNITGLPCMSEGTFKGVEKSFGHTVETALSESCTIDKRRKEIGEFRRYKRSGRYRQSVERSV